MRGIAGCKIMRTPKMDSIATAVERAGHSLAGAPQGQLGEYLNVALREPGYSRKGSIVSETRAAAAGGVTSLCCPPKTKPVLDTSAVAELILDRALKGGGEFGHREFGQIGQVSGRGCFAHGLMIQGGDENWRGSL